MKRILASLTVTLLLSLGLPARAGMVTGQWEFDGDFTASVGADLLPVGLAASGSVFGTTTALGVPDIGGQVARVMMFPQLPGSGDGYKMFPGAAANGSTADVNQYSLVMDILYPASSGGYRALFQTAAANGNDADWFVNPSNGLGISGQYSGNLTADTWHRIALVVDLESADTTKRFASYIDGALAGYVNLGSTGAPGGRWSVWPAASGNPSWILSDNDGETAIGYVNSVQFRDYAMTADEVAGLGGPSAAGIPAIPEPASGLLLIAGLALLAGRKGRAGR